MDARPQLGRTGEDAAARMYEGLGFRVVDRNFRCREGEIDIVARRGKVLVFCEVKTRSTERWGHPWEAVDPRKQARLRILAARWMREFPPGRVEVRFDVVSVIVHDGENEVVYLPNAF